MGDVLAAVNIARLEGEVVDAREIDPTEGRFRSSKTARANRAEHNRAIDEVLARRVAAGELTIDEALSKHQNGSGDEKRGGRNRPIGRPAESGRQRTR